MSMTADDVRELLNYDPTTGDLKWRSTLSKRAVAGKPAGTTKSRYVYVGIGGRKYLGHRVIWLMLNGEWPSGHLDHVNGDCRDNRIENLRLATVAQNAANRPRYANNSCGFKGVSRKRMRWTASIKHKGKKYELGVFDTPELAHAAYRAKAVALNGEFARTE